MAKLSEVIKRKIGAELSEISRSVDNVSTVMLTFEKYYFRNGSYASLSVLLIENPVIQTADIVGYGGGESLLKISWRANKEFAENAKNILCKVGFSIEES